MVKFEYYMSEGQWYWRIRARNGRIVADGSESYVSKRNILRAINKFVEDIVWSSEDVKVVEVKS
jgi:uncharacterized protein YegP (UPF0339 family)